MRVLKYYVENKALLETWKYERHGLENVYTSLSWTEICLDLTCVNNSFCACICTCTCVCACLCIRFGVCIYVCMYVLYMYVCMYVYMCTYMCMYMWMYIYIYAYVYVYDISTILWLMFLTCIFSDFIWLVDFRYCMFLVFPFYSLMLFYTPFNVAFMLIVCSILQVFTLSEMTKIKMFNQYH